MAIMDDVARQRAEYFKQKRAEAQGQVGAQTQEAQDVIQRRFASLGAQGSGAQVAAEQKMREQAGAQARQAQTDITGQELAANEGDIGRRFQAEQAQLGREYGTSERLGSQQFAGEQAGLGREFTTSERLAAQTYGSDEAGKTRQFQAGQQLLQNIFASGEAALGRKFTSEEQAKQNQFLAGQSQASRELQSRLAADDLALKKSALDMQNAKDQRAYDLAKKQFEEDVATTSFNKYLSMFMAGIPLSELRKISGQSGETVSDNQSIVDRMIANEVAAAAERQRIEREARDRANKEFVPR